MTPLNEPQQNSVRTSFCVLHKKMAELEGLMSEGAKPSPFSHYVPDLSPTEAKVVRDYFARIRAVMLSDLEEAGIPLELRRTSLRWAVQCGAMSLSVMVDEMGPRKLSNYGPLDDEGRQRAAKVQEDVRRLVDRLAAYIREGQGKDLAVRLARLGQTTGGAEVLSRLERVIARWQLVEFRPVITMILGRLESPTFEVALFGRVSSGKSSLLNHIAGRDALPVGVTPVTAVPTRLLGGDSATAAVSFAELPSRPIPIADLWQYASEEGNPGNSKHVTGIVVTLPSPRLERGVVFVDTPGVGSLALAGGEEALAYLPRADLGVVLVDSASTVNDEDLALLRALNAAGIPSMVLLSKADLVTGEDRARIIRYMEDQFRRELGLDLPIHPVSIVGEGEKLLDMWFEVELRPLLLRHQALAEASIRRKISAVRESVVAVLQTTLARRRGAMPEQAATDAGAAKGRLLEADRAILQVNERIVLWREENRSRLEAAIKRVACLASGGPGGTGPCSLSDAVERTLLERAGEVHGTLLWLRDVLGAALRGSGRDDGSLTPNVLGGLPAPDTSGLISLGDERLPAWARLLQRLSGTLGTREIVRLFRPRIEEVVERYEIQLDAWSRRSLVELSARYEEEAEALREQARRLQARVSEGPPAEIEELERDIRDLQAPVAPDVTSAECA